MSTAFLYFFRGKAQSIAFFAAYTTSFKTVISLGLIIGTALIVYWSQDLIPNTIETAFKNNPATENDLPKLYYRYRSCFTSVHRSLIFSASFIVAGFMIFYFCKFPLPRSGETLMIIPACAEYGLGVYIGRKLCYIGMMLHSLLDASVTRNLFAERELDEINSYVHIVSTLTVIFIYIHVIGYYRGPFLYNSVIGASAKMFLILPTLIAPPVLLIFNFYPRIVLQRIYGQSIEVEKKRLHEALQDENLSSFEKRSYLLEFDRMSQEELRYSLQLTLSDLPIGITILVMVLEPLLGK
jgi:hypothetical protein